MNNMKYELKKANINQPLGTFEHMFTDAGQLILKGAFFNKYHEDPYYDPENDKDPLYHEWEFDLEKEYISRYWPVSDDDYEEQKFYFLNFLRDTFKYHYNILIELFKERIDSCDGLSKEYYTLYTLRRKIARFRSFVTESATMPHRALQLKWLTNIENGLISTYEKHTGFVTFIDQKLKPNQVATVVKELIKELDLSTDPADVDKIVYFICSNNMIEDFGFINYGCTTYTLKQIIIKFQSFGFLRFKDVEIVNSEFFRRNSKPISQDNFYNSTCTSNKKIMEIQKKIDEAFKTHK